mmetsp:Transcript_18796/g.60056  ORF Transcript_18796/g.60056 Transcript_18796/m.60056 type:complete len:200 (-) Transcript_18796:842-1441(-)
MHGPLGCHVPPLPWFVWPQLQQKSALHRRHLMWLHPPFFSIGMWQLGHGFVPSPTCGDSAIAPPWRAAKTLRSAHVAGQWGSSPHKGHQRVPHAPHAASQHGWSQVAVHVARTSMAQVAEGQCDSSGRLRTAALERIVRSESKAVLSIAACRMASGTAAPQPDWAQRIVVAAPSVSAAATVSVAYRRQQSRHIVCPQPA